MSLFFFFKASMSIENRNLSRFLQYITNVANQKELFGEGFEGDKTFPLIILLAKWVYQLVRGRLFLVTNTWPVLVLFSIPSLGWFACIWKGLEVQMGGKYDGGTNAICWNVDIIANEKLTRHINFWPPLTG